MPSVHVPDQHPLAAGTSMICAAPGSVVKRAYATATVVTAERIVFNIKGNAYRLVVAVDFEKRIVWIKWLGTHEDYDRIDVREVDYER